MRTLTFSAVLFCFLIVPVAGQNSPEQLAQLKRDFRENIAQHELMTRLTRNPMLPMLINRWADSPSMFAGIELVDSQKEEIQNLHASYIERLQEIHPGFPNTLEFKAIRASESWHDLDRQQRAAVKGLESEFRVEVAEIFLPHQLQILQHANIGQSGMPRLLVDSPIGEILEISESQRERIREKSDLLAKEIESALQKLRQDAADILAEELTDDQWSQLKELLGQQTIFRYYAGADLRKVYSDHLFDNQDNESSYRDRISQVWWANVRIKGKEFFDLLEESSNGNSK